MTSRLTSNQKQLQGCILLAPRVDYDPETGAFTWNHNTPRAGKIATHRTAAGYLRVAVKLPDGTQANIRAHRLAWFLRYGKLPDHEIDHINQDRADNRIANLRDVPRSVNARNARRPSTNKTGYSGVVLVPKSGKYRAYGQSFDPATGKDHVHLGMFDDPAEAYKSVLAYRATRGYSENHGRAAAVF